MSADIMLSLWHLQTRPRDMLFLLKDTSAIEEEKVFQGMQICLFVCSPEPLQGGIPTQSVKI